MDKVQNSTTKVVDFVSNLSSSAVFLIAIFVLIAVTMYLYVEYKFFSKKTNNIAPKIYDEYEYQYQVKDEHYIKDLQEKTKRMGLDQKYALMVLIKSSIEAYRVNVNSWTHVDFYKRPVGDILATDKWFTKPLAMARFLSDNRGIRPSDVDFLIEILYDSTESPRLYVNHNQVQYYIPNQFDIALKIYLKNKEYLDKVVYY